MHSNNLLSRRIQSVCCVLALLFIFSCKSGEKLYNKGRYDEAVMAFVKKLQRRPHDATALRLLPDAYKQSFQHHEANATRLIQENNELKWEKIRMEYRSMQTLFNAIHNSPAALAVVTPKDYSAAIKGALEMAAQERYDRGTYLLDAGDKASARNAYYEFDEALKLVKNYRNAQDLKNLAYQRAVINVAISQIDIRSPYFQFSADQFRDFLVRNVQSQHINTFVQFYDESFANANKVPVDQYLELHFFDFIVGQTYVDRTQRDVSKEIVESTSKDSTGKEIKKYKTVKATVFITRQTVVSKGMLDYRIINTMDSKVLRQNRIPGSYTWVNQFGTYRGDNRALSEEDQKMMGGRELLPPPPDQLFLEFTKPIYVDMERELKTFYSVM
ncbi:hypothetical protein [Chitinophaga sp. Cy-1792]|uniref:hypothetical protein n=1 Tax=Chitinophaga sp. Cy-1792 TaxID=2608339 RepID=UPI00141FEF96|nr:hypothetical protein [Chitinophaga sp. Cy-1792]NIG56350.1 hypothetical protein [Chitinophaga sp. Cy-1792]